MADGTGEGLLPGVDSHMLLKAALVVELFVAHRTGVDKLALVLVLTHPSLVPVSASMKIYK